MNDGRYKTILPSYTVFLDPIYQPTNELEGLWIQFSNMNVTTQHFK